MWASEWIREFINQQNDRAAVLGFQDSANYLLLPHHFPGRYRQRVSYVEVILWILLNMSGCGPRSVDVYCIRRFSPMSFTPG